MSALASGLWCDDFDTDLPKVVPDWLDFLGYAADIELRTYCHPTNGKINCPCAWWTDSGLTAFFATRNYGGIAPAGFWTDEPVVDCTFAEAVRDEWIHGQVVVVNGVIIWRPPNTLMERLMYDVRGWRALDDIERAEVKRHVRRSLAGAAERLLELVA